MLLELEAKLGLLHESSSFRYADLWPHGIFSFDAIHDLLAPFHARRVAFHRQAESDAKFFAANPGAKRAFFSAWMEQSPSATQVAKAEKQKSANFMSGILDELLGTGHEKPAAMRPTEEQMPNVNQSPKLAATKMPMRFGAKKESI